MPIRNGADAGDQLRALLDTMDRPIAVPVSEGIDGLALSHFARRLMADRVTMFRAVSPAVPGDATARVERLADGAGCG